MSAHACPLTPPRSSGRRHTRSLHIPSTPDKTPHHASSSLITPISIQKPASRLHFLPPSNTASTAAPQKSHASAQLPLKHHTLLASPDATPHFSPRRRRKDTPDVMFNLFSPERTAHDSLPRFSFGPLIPGHSTVGTGRTQVQGRARISIFSQPKLYAGESDLDGEPMPEIDSSEPVPHSSSETPRRLDGKSEVFPPQTPGKQLITESLVKHWHGSSNNGFSSDEEDIDQVKSRRTKPENPFIDTKTSTSPPPLAPAKNIFAPHNSAPQINYNTHMELVNHRTGARRIVKLSSRQSQIKPKKLDFSTC